MRTLTSGLLRDDALCSENWPNALQNNRLLVAGDDPSVRRLIRSLLFLDGLPAFECGLSACIGIVARQAPRAILLDLAPHSHVGLGALGRIRDVAPTLPIIVALREHDEDLIARASAGGASGYVMHPAQWETWRRTLASHLPEFSRAGAPAPSEAGEPGPARLET